jgi:hypothetical protein
MRFITLLRLCNNLAPDQEILVLKRDTPFRLIIMDQEKHAAKCNDDSNSYMEHYKIYHPRHMAWFLSTNLKIELNSMP